MGCTCLRKPAVPSVATGGVNRGALAWSFVVPAWAVDKKGGKEWLVGVKSMLGGWHISGCFNCQSYLERTFYRTGMERKMLRRRNLWPGSTIVRKGDPGMGADGEDGMDGRTCPAGCLCHSTNNCPPRQVKMEKTDSSCLMTKSTAMLCRSGSSEQNTKGKLPSE